MDNREQLRRITELTEQIAGLPKGYLSKKTIGGKVYYYHQWSENGVKQSRYLHDSEIAPLADKIEKRKELQAQLRMLKSQKSRRNEATGMKCTFMHKRTPVAELELDDVTGFIQKIGSVYAPEHLPIGIPVRNEIADRAAFNDWWRDRSIPASRSGVREALESLGVADTKMLLVRCYGSVRKARSFGGRISTFSKMISRRTSEMCCSENERRRTHSISAPPTAHRTAI